MGESTALFSVSLVVTTRGRYEPLAARLPVWAAAGFDEVIVVDGSSDSGTRAKTSSLCERNGVVYVPGPVRLRDTRSLSRNLGARNAHGTWILFQDDDDDAVVSIDKNALRAATIGKDWLAGPRGEIIVWHRKEAFLAFGGYPEDMVAAEDWIMSNRARAHGKGGLEPTWYEGERRFPPSRQDPIGRSRNAFWYGYTLLLFLLRCPNSTDVIVGDSARLLLQVGQAFRQLRAFVYVGMGLFGRALSPVHCLKVRVQSGKDAIRQEPFADWQGIRP